MDNNPWIPKSSPINSGWDQTASLTQQKTGGNDLSNLFNGTTGGVKTPLRQSMFGRQKKMPVSRSLLNNNQSPFAAPGFTTRQSTPRPMSPLSSSPFPSASNGYEAPLPATSTPSAPVPSTPSPSGTTTPGTGLTPEQVAARNVSLTPEQVAELNAQIAQIDQNDPNSWATFLNSSDYPVQSTKDLLAEYPPLPGESSRAWILRVGAAKREIEMARPASDFTYGDDRYWAARMLEPGANKEAVEAEMRAYREDLKAESDAARAAARAPLMAERSAAFDQQRPGGVPTPSLQRLVNTF